MSTRQTRALMIGICCGAEASVLLAAWALPSRAFWAIVVLLMVINGCRAWLIKNPRTA